MSGKDKNKILLLLDAHAIIHRAYHAIPDFATSKGEPTGALYGIVSMLLKAIKDLKPDYIAAAYDLPEPTFRHIAYENYKAGRPKIEDALVSQIERSRDIFKAFSIPIYEAPSFEADDVLGTIAEVTRKIKDLLVVIASGDMDTLQLVEGERVRVYTLKKGISDTIIYDEEKVVERFGFPPKLLPDYKGLRGDPSDNIVGVKGIGEKTASILIGKLGSIENIYKTIKKDKTKLSTLGLTDRIIKLLEESEEEALFSKTLAEIRKDTPISFKLPSRSWKEGANVVIIEKLLQEFEFKSLISRVRDVLGEANGTKDVLPEKDIEEDDPEILEKAKIALWLIDSEKNNPSREDVISQAKKENLQEALKALEVELKKEKLLEVYEEIELPLIPIISGAEKRGIEIDKKQFDKLSKEFHKKLEAVEKNIYKAAGGEFNINSPKQMGEVLFDKLMLAPKGGRMRKTEGGARSTRISELEKIKDLHPIVPFIIEQREIQKLLSTYIDAIPPLVADDGALHTHFVQTGAATGRFASVSPNLQNVPIRGETGKLIRQGFVARKGYKLLSFDYSQIELRVAAILSGDEHLVEIFKKGEDVHTAVAMRVFKVKEHDVTSEMRRQAKVINFGIIYGMGVNALRANLGSTRAEAEEFYDKYLKEFSKLNDYLEGVKLSAKKSGFTETLFGRKRRFPALRSPIPFIKAMAERMAINAPLQGTAADIIKLAIRFADEDLKRENLSSKVHLLLQIHDELIYEVEERAVTLAEAVIKKAMEGVLGRSYKKLKSEVPIIANYSVGDNWGDI